MVIGAWLAVVGNGLFILDVGLGLENKKQQCFDLIHSCH